MLSIKGDLGLMNLGELLQWADAGQKDGTLIITQEDATKFFFFQNGKLIYFSSLKAGERFANFVVAANYLRQEQLEDAMAASKRLAIPFISYLISEKILARETIQYILEEILQSAIADSLEWDRGTFEFKETIPDTIRSGPIRLDITPLLFRSSVKYDEELATEASQTARIQEDLARKIQTGSLDLPPAPSIIQKLQEISQDDSIPITELSRFLMSDQILTSKILKVANSPFYNLAGEVTSLHHAITVLGLASIKSIATAHCLGQMSPANEKKIRPILRHSLEVGFIAKKIASRLHLDQETLFVCGMLHDIGKTILITFLDSYKLPDELKAKIIVSFHCQAGFLLAKKWQFSAVVQETISLHHAPSRATNHDNEVKLVNLADRLAHTERALDLLQPLCRVFQADEAKIAPLLEEIEEVRRQPMDLF